VKTKKQIEKDMKDFAEFKKVLVRHQKKDD
jgi:hypothetical protein